MFIGNYDVATTCTIALNKPCKTFIFNKTRKNIVIIWFIIIVSMLIFDRRVEFWVRFSFTHRSFGWHAQIAGSVSLRPSASSHCVQPKWKKNIWLFIPHWSLIRKEINGWKIFLFMTKENWLCNIKLWFWCQNLRLYQTVKCEV